MSASPSTRAQSRRLHPRGRPLGLESIRAKTIAPNPSTANRPPAQSNRRCSSPAELSGTFQTVRNRTVSPTGTLMKNTHRQEPCCVNHPPRTGPVAAVMEVNQDQVPIARPRSPSEKLALIRARLPGTSNAPPTPVRLCDNQPSNVGRPARNMVEAAEKSATPIANTVRRPYMSPRTPPTSSSAARNNAYDSTTH